jgi:ABC-2 type transport system ATP-binding protein
MSKDKQTLINAHNVSRYYGDHCAIDDISFSVARGEVLGFLGPNRAGKSTTMQIVCGVLAASEDIVTIADYDIADEARLAKQHLGFLADEISKEKI